MLPSLCIYFSNVICDFCTIENIEKQRMIVQIRPLSKNIFDCFPTERLFSKISNYNEPRNHLNFNINEMSSVSLLIILYGDESLSLHYNERIFAAVRSYIRASGRFAV